MRINNNSTDVVFVDGNVFNGLQDFSISTYVKLDGLNSNNNLISCANNSEANEFILGYNSLDDQFQDGWHIIVDNEFHPFGQDNITNDLEWHHVLVIREGTTGHLYIDDTFISSINISSKQLEVHQEGFVIGQDQDCVEGCFKQDQSWFGLIDELKVFSKILDESEIADLDCSTTRLQNDEKFNPIKTYPNPAHNTLFIKTENEQIDEMSLINISGQSVYQGKFKNEISVSDFTSGIYFLQLKNKEGKLIKTEKVIIINEIRV